MDLITYTLLMLVGSVLVLVFAIELLENRLMAATVYGMLGFMFIGLAVLNSPIKLW